jgi:hypothetical protein
MLLEFPLSSQPALFMKVRRESVQTRSETKGLAPPSAAVPVPLLLRQGQAPRKRAPVPNSMSKG